MYWKIVFLAIFELRSAQQVVCLLLPSSHAANSLPLLPIPHSPFLFSPVPCSGAAAGKEQEPKPLGWSERVWAEQDRLLGAIPVPPSSACLLLGQMGMLAISWHGPKKGSVGAPGLAHPRMGCIRLGTSKYRGLVKTLLEQFFKSLLVLLLPFFKIHIGSFTHSPLSHPKSPVHSP